MHSNNNFIGEEIFSQFQAGSETAFNKIYNCYWERLFFIAYKSLLSTDDARDVIQNVFINLWEKKEELRIRNLPHYLAAATRYAVYRHLANEKRRAELIKKFSYTQGKKVAPTFDFDNKYLIDILTHLTSELPMHYSIIFIHHKLHDRPLNEVAEELQMPPRTAERHLRTVLKIMRKYLSKLPLCIFM